MKKVISLLVLSVLFTYNAMAQQSVTITVNPNPTIQAATSPVEKCPDATVAYASNTFTLAEAGATAAVSTGTAIVQYCADQNFADATLLDEDYEITVNAGESATYYARALVEATGCTSDPIALEFSVYEFPNLTIIGETPVCATSTQAYTTTETTADTDYSWSVTNGTISGSVTNSTVNIQWAATTTDIIGTITLTYISTDGCSFIVTKDIEISSMPTFTVANVATCNNTAIDLNSAISAIAPSEATFEFSDDAFTGTISTPAAYTPSASATTISVRATVGSCVSPVQTFTLTMYDAIVANVQVLNGGTPETNYEECSVTGDNSNNTITLQLTVSGGCPDNESYSVAWHGDTGITGTSPVTVTKTVGENGGTAQFTVTVPADNTQRNLTLDSATESGVNSCGCAWEASE